MRCSCCTTRESSLDSRSCELRVLLVVRAASLTPRKPAASRPCGCAARRRRALAATRALRMTDVERRQPEEAAARTPRSLLRFFWKQHATQFPPRTFLDYCRYMAAPCARYKPPPRPSGTTRNDITIPSNTLPRQYRTTRRPMSVTGSAGGASVHAISAGASVTVKAAAKKGHAISAAAGGAGSGCLGRARIGSARAAGGAGRAAIREARSAVRKKLFGFPFCLHACKPRCTGASCRSWASR
jgi:hypothetical protein